AVRGLDIGESRNDDSPDSFDGVDGQAAAVAFDDRLHHRSLACRAKRRTASVACFDFDEAVDNAAALDQQVMHGLVDLINLDPQFSKRGFRRLGHGRTLSSFRLRPPKAASILHSPDQVFIDSKNPEFVFVSRNLPRRNSIASTVPIGLRIRRKTYIFLRMSGGTSSSSLRVPERVMSIEGKVRLSATFRSRMISELPVPLNSSKITSSMREPVSMSAVAMMVSEPPSSMLRAAPKKRFGRCKALASTPPVSTLPDGGTMVLYARPNRVIESRRMSTSLPCSTSRLAF